MTMRVVTMLLIGLLAVPSWPALAGQDDGDAAVKRELKNIAGKWTEISRVRDGQNLPADQLGTMTQDENGNTEQRAGGRFGLTYSVKIDPTSTPKTIDYIVPGGAMRGARPSTIAGAAGETRRGIYELNGDTLRICLARPGKERPKQFVSPSGEDLILSTYQRVR